MSTNEELRADISRKLEALSDITKEVGARERRRDAITSLVLLFISLATLFIVLRTWFIVPLAVTAFVAGAASINALHYVRRWLGLDD